MLGAGAFEQRTRSDAKVLRNISATPVPNIMVWSSGFQEAAKDIWKLWRIVERRSWMRMLGLEIGKRRMAIIMWKWMRVGSVWGKKFRVNNEG